MRKFVEVFEPAISRAATHIYLSALAFCPSDSWVARLYCPWCPNTLSVTSGRRTVWGMAATTGEGHEGEVLSVAFFPDGKKLASAAVDGVGIWDPQTGKAVSPRLEGYAPIALCIAISPDGKFIASGHAQSDDGILRIWDSNTGACPLEPIEAHDDPILSVAFSPDGSRIATGSRDETVKVWAVETGSLHLGPLRGHTNYVRSVVFSPDAKYIVSGNNDRTIRIWDASTGKSCRDPLVEHTDTVGCVTFSADGHKLASASEDGTIRLWDATEGFAPIATTTSTSNTPPFSLSFSPNSDHLVSGHRGGALRFWHFGDTNIEQLGEAIYGHDGAVCSVKYSPDGLSVASCFDNGSIKIWSVPTAPLPGTVTQLYI